MSQQLPNIEENNEQLLNDIQSLQSMEQELFNSLETNPNLTSQQQQKIVEKINQLSQMRINLYKTLSGVNSYYQNALVTSQGTLQEQSSAIQIVENELNQAKERLRIIEQEKNNKIRLVEINTYYGDKYAEHASLMKIVIFMLVPVIILALLNKKGILPTTIYYGLICIIAVIGGYFFWMRIGSIIMRDNMNYQEYDWMFDPNSAPTGSSNSNDPWFNSSINIGTCVGQQCCSEGQIYDTSLNMCVLDTTTSAGTVSESFITETLANQVLTKTNVTNKYKHQNILSPSPKPNTSDGFTNYLHI
uniref:Uncharacterized protein n=1 Tax=viral metagenome TaxID=1070528 RepID=A0A6C0EPK6_9ZZZZ